MSAPRSSPYRWRPNGLASEATLQGWQTPTASQASQRSTGAGQKSSISLTGTLMERAAFRGIILFSLVLARVAGGAQDT
jgi:hypothetical protein